MRNIRKKFEYLAWGALALSVSTGAMGAASVWTMRQDNNRSSAFLSEKLLTTSNVNTTNFGKLFTLPADDQVYTTPLYMSDISSRGSTGKDTVYFASVNNTVYAYDANNGALLWSKNLNNGFRPFAQPDANAFGACGGNYTNAPGNMGIIGTPVIDVKTKTLYVVTKTVENGIFTPRLHAMDITNGGAEKFGGPVLISATGFDPKIHNQRPGLVLVNNVVYIGWASYCDAGAYKGYLMGYNAGTLAQTGFWTATNGGRAGIWQAGQPPAADGSGNLYLATGNGRNDWNGTTNYPESVVKLSTNATGGIGGVTSYWTPSNWSSLDSADADQGAAGLLLLPGQTRLVQGGKEGSLHLLDTANLGGLGGGIQQFQSTFSQNGGPKHIHGAPIYWKSGTNGGLLYVWGEDDYIRTYKYDPTTNFTTTPWKIGTVLAPQIGKGMPGANLAISAKGNTAGTGIVWAYAVQDGDANVDTRPGVLRAYNADDAVTELWNSRQVASDDCGNLAKYTHPVVVNSKVFLSSFGNATKNSGQVCVYGLKNNPAQPAGGVANYPGGFSGATQIAYNGSAYLNGSAVRLTDGRGYQAGSMFFLHKADVTGFHSNFSFKLSSGATADGFTFTIHNGSPYAVGAQGSGLGYGAAPGTPATGIPGSVAIKFDLFNNTSEGANSTGLYINGAEPTTPSTALPANIDLHSGHQFDVAMVYSGTTLTVTIKDAVTAATATQTYNINIPGTIGNTAYVGFTGGTGGQSATQEILNWTYTNP